MLWAAAGCSLIGCVVIESLFTILAAATALSSHGEKDPFKAQTRLQPLRMLSVSINLMAKNLLQTERGSATSTVHHARSKQ